VSSPLPPILVIEDDPQQALLLRSVLWRARLVNPIVVAATGDDADAALASATSPTVAADDTPVLVLLDLRLGDWSGLAFLERLRQTFDSHALPVVVLSGSGEAGDIDRAFEIGANSYLVKPVAFDALIDTLENLGLPRAILPPSAVAERPHPAGPPG